MVYCAGVKSCGDGAGGGAYGIPRLQHQHGDNTKRAGDDAGKPENMHMDIKDVRADLKGIQKDVQNVEKAQAALEARHSYRSIQGNP
jgi:hypothetical protein